ncbi:MAG: cold-shock protein [archaeon]|nr:cold-shock protein [archaeon]
MVNGTVKWFNSRKGYGFISAEDETEIFVHYSALAGEEGSYKTLYENDKVEFEITQGDKGPQASNVVVTEKAPRQDYNRGQRY